MLTLTKRWKHFAAMALLGDAVMAMVHPERDASVWNIGPKPWRMLMGSLREHPNLTRTLGGVQAAAVMYWLIQQEKEEEQGSV